MKKIFRLFLCLLLVFTLASCDMSFGGTTEKQDGFEITLDAQNGESTKVIYGEGAVELETPERDGYTFIGWYEADDEPYSGKIDADITLTAKWVKIGQKFNIFLDTNGGKFTSNYESTYAHGTEQELPIPELKYNEFEGWFKDEELTDGPYTKIDKDAYGSQFFYAAWKDVAVYKTVTYVLDGGVLPQSAPTEYIPGEIYKLQPAIKEGYIFRGWFNNPDFTGNIIKVINAGQKNDLTFYAKFVEAIPENLNVSVYGDSITTYQGWIPTGYPAAYPNYDLTSVEETWWRIAIKDAGMNYCANASYSGGNVRGTDTLSGNNLDRIAKLASATTGNPDVVIIHMGINDVTNVQEPQATFKSEYKRMIASIQDTFPGVNVIICTMIRAKDFGSVTSETLYNQYNQAIMEIAEEMNLPLVRLDLVVTAENMNTLMGDNKHPNKAGMAAMAAEVVKVLKQVYPTEE